MTIPERLVPSPQGDHTLIVIPTYNEMETLPDILTRVWDHVPHAHILIVDDFLANGNALNGLLSICEEAGANVVGFAIAVEKGFQGGGDALRARGYRVESLANVSNMDPETGEITFSETRTAEETPQMREEANQILAEANAAANSPAE